MTYQQKSNLNNLVFKILMGSTALMGLVIGIADIMANPSKASVLTLIGVLVFLSVIYLVVFVLSATFNFSENGFWYRYPPWVNKPVNVASTDIAHITIKQTAALTEFGGWGYRFKKNHRGLIFLHDWCAEFELHNGKKITVTLADVDAFRAVAQAHYLNILR